MNMVERAFDQLEGWSIVDTTTFQILNGQYDYQPAFLGEVVRQTGAERLNEALTTKEPIEFFFKSNSEALNALKQFQQVVNTKNSAKAKAKAPNGKADALRLYSSKPHIQPYPHASGSFALTVDRMWVGLPGWHISSAKGTSVDLPSPMTRKGKPVDPNRLEKFGKFWTWTYKNGLAESAKAALAAQNSETVEMTTAPAAKRQQLQQQRIMLPEVRKLLESFSKA